MGRRDRKKLQTRAALADAALRLAAERGLDHVTVEDISEAADVSSRTFFNYFGSKDEAILDGHAINSYEIRNILQTLVPDMPALAAIRLSLNFAIAQMEVDREAWLLRMRVIDANPSLLSSLVAGGAEAERDLVATIGAGLGLDPDHPFPALIVAVTGAAFRAAIVRWAAADGRLTLAELVDEAFAAVATGLPNPDVAPLHSRPHRRVRASRKDIA